jgi:type IV pilus assembly protein PilN
MANINLLPWREDQRQELKKEFLVILGGIAVFALVLVILADTVVNGAISAQRSRNTYLQKHIDELSSQVKEIRELEKRKRELLDRMKVIQELQGNRPVIVRIFDEMVRSLPDGVFYRELTRTNNMVELKGVAESNNRISSLMRNVDRSDWFASPNLTTVKADSALGEQASGFGLSFNISTPAVGGEE